MKNHSMVIWSDVDVRVTEKRRHYKKDRERTGFCTTFGDLPIGVINETTNKWEPTVNTRGFAYACRRRCCYRKKTTE